VKLKSTDTLLTSIYIYRRVKL